MKIWIWMVCGGIIGFGWITPNTQAFEIQILKIRQANTEVAKLTNPVDGNAFPSLKIQKEQGITFIWNVESQLRYWMTFEIQDIEDKEKFTRLGATVYPAGKSRPPIPSGTTNCWVNSFGQMICKSQKPARIDLTRWIESGQEAKIYWRFCPITQEGQTLACREFLIPMKVNHLRTGR